MLMGNLSYMTNFYTNEMVMNPYREGFIIWEAQIFIPSFAVPIHSGLVLDLLALLQEKS